MESAAHQNKDCTVPRLFQKQTGREDYGKEIVARMLSFLILNVNDFYDSYDSCDSYDRIRVPMSLTDRSFLLSTKTIRYDDTRSTGRLPYFTGQIEP